MSLVPTEGFQLDFLRKLQRLFNEGQFVATYKFALLNAIADLAVATYFVARIRRLGMHSIGKRSGKLLQGTDRARLLRYRPPPKKVTTKG